MEDPPLTETQQLLTAYVDGELGPEQRAEFEERMAEDPELAAEAARHRELLELSRSMALTEPTDHEVRRFWARFYNRTEWRLGWCLLILGLVVLVGEAVYLLVTTEMMSWVSKLAVVSVLLGAAILLWNTLRLKIRTSRFDRYRGVLR